MDHRSERHSQTRIEKIALELEVLRENDACSEVRANDSSSSPTREASLPKACLQEIRSLPGNSRCMDCGRPNPHWASLSFGILLCLQCAGRHRSYGVSTSRIRSLNMDSWSHEQSLLLLEGGNDQLHRFFDRHEMGTTNNINRRLLDQRYRTKAAAFYRKRLKHHAVMVANTGMWKGREISRKLATSRANIDPSPPKQVLPSCISAR